MDFFLSTKLPWLTQSNPSVAGHSWHWFFPAGGTFESDMPGTFQTVTNGTFLSATAGTFQSDTDGTFIPLLSAHSLKQVVPGKDAPKLLPWVHIAISNAKSLFADMYHGVKDEFLQEYLNEFCYKFNRMFFGERLFDRLMLASISYRPEFEHRIYNHSDNRG